MKKYIYTVTAFAVFAASALANQANELNLKAPFAFQAGGYTLPAGTYRVSEANSGVLLIRGEKGGVFVPRSALIPDPEDEGKGSFKFDRAAGQYVLQLVHTEK